MWQLTASQVWRIPAVASESQRADSQRVPGANGAMHHSRLQLHPHTHNLQQQKTLIYDIPIDFLFFFITNHTPAVFSHTGLAASRLIPGANPPRLGHLHPHKPTRRSPANLSRKAKVQSGPSHGNHSLRDMGSTVGCPFFLTTCEPVLPTSRR